MQVPTRWRIALFASVLAVAACDGMPPSENPLAGLADGQTLVVAPEIVAIPEVGRTAQLQLSIEGAGASTIERGVVWTSADPSIVEVSQDGLLLSQGHGVTEVSASYLGSRAEAMVYSVPDVAKVDVIGSTTLNAFDTASFQVNVLSSQGEPAIAPPARWTSSDPTAATVDANGLITTMASGETLIRAEVAGRSDSLTVTVLGGAMSARGPSPSRAFPEAEGYGAKATVACDRTNVQVLKVTNTNGSGAGSFKDALDKNDRRRMTVVVFETGGTIRGGFRVNYGCLYIAGQTAPGDGIQIHNHGSTALSLHRTSNVKDIVIRHLKLRSGKGTPGKADVMSVFGGRDIILDHLSAQFGNDEVLSITPPAARNAVGVQRLTLQRSMIAVGLVPHTRGSLMIVPKNDPSMPLEELSIHHNLWAHSGGRNPSYRGVSRVEHINNVAYNWKGNVGMVDGGAEVDYVKNYFKAGPWSKPDRIMGHDTLGAPAKVYATGNVADPFQMSASANQKKLFNYRAKWTPLPSNTFVSGRRARPAIRVQEQSASAAYRSVIGNVGANGQITCDGSWRQKSDPLDRRILDHVKNRRGPGGDSGMDHPNDFVGVPHLAKGKACRDRDNDGMPDDFEKRYGLNDQDAGDATKDSDGDGYTNIEEYVNGTRPR
ncbi:MAG: Ig-like domain-containing protein [Longimicrobiales bacterium]